MTILDKARRLESTIARTIDEAAQRITKSGPREPLEVLHAIVGAIECEVQPAGRGAHLFPFNRLKISVVAPSGAARARFEALFDGDPSLNDRIGERLGHAGCDVAGLTTRIQYVAQCEGGWSNPDFHIEFVRASKTVAAPPAVEAPGPQIALTILAGVAVEDAYAFTLRRIDIGRCVEVRDSRNRLIRTNHVAFADGGADSNQSVSRRHAHIEYAPESADYRVFDDRSAHGTAVLRGGRTVPVPAGSRGVRLRSGDEIALGEARVRVTIPNS